MVNYKQVEVQGDYELVSFVQKDLTHYAIRIIETQEILETIAPTKELNGWALRKAVVEKLHTYNSDTSKVSATFKQTKSIVTDVQELEVGMVITYANPNWTGDQRFCKILHLGEWLVTGIGPNGENLFWSYESLAKLLDKGTFKIIPANKVPEGVTFPESTDQI